MWGLEWLSLSGFFWKETPESHHTASQLKSNGAVPEEATELPGSDGLGKEHESPFLRLPAELRVMIYDFALQDMIDDPGTDKSTNKDHKDMPGRKHRPFLPFVGALALLNTNRKLRNEGFLTMESIAHRKAAKLLQDTGVSRTKVRPTSGPKTEEDHLKDEHEHFVLLDAAIYACKLTVLLARLCDPGRFAGIPKCRYTLP